MNKSNIDKQLTAHYEEFRVLSQEIQQRVDRQEKLSHLSIIIASILFTVYGLTINNPSISLVLLMFPIMYCIIIWLILRHDTMLYTLADYLFTNLRPKVNQLLQLTDSNSVWLWERFRYNQHLESGCIRSIFHRFLAFVRYGIPFLLSIVSMFLFVYIKYSNNIDFETGDIIMFCFNLALITFTLALMLFWVTQPLKEDLYGKKRQNTI